VAAEVLELDGRASRRSRAGLAVALALVLAAVLAGYVLTQRGQRQLVSAETARQALAASFPERVAPVPLTPPGSPEGTGPTVLPGQCRPLLLRPWLPGAWLPGAVSGFRTGAPGVDSYPSSEVFTFTTRRTSDAERLFADLRSALTSHVCDRATVQPSDPTDRPFSVTVEQQSPDSAPDRPCALLSYVATASPPQLGSPESVTTEVLQYGNTVSLLVQLSEADVVVFAGSYLHKDRERPTLTTVCRELERLGAGR
jgi:hypothetical protein